MDTNELCATKNYTVTVGNPHEWILEVLEVLATANVTLEYGLLCGTACSLHQLLAVLEILSTCICSRLLNDYETCIVSCQKNIFMQSRYCWQALHHWVVFRDTVGVGCECINSISNVCCAGPAINLIIITFCSSVLSAECAWKSSWVYSQHTQATHVEVTKSSQKLP